jgi:DNA polymerase elongation subunit (family B)
MSKKHEQIFVYSWYHDEKEQNVTVIRVYGLDKRNKTVCLMIYDFLPYIYVELPTNIKWTQTKAQMVVDKLSYLCGNQEAITKSFQYKKRLYYAHKVRNRDGKRKDRLFPYLKLSFANSRDITSLYYKLRKPLFVSGLGRLNLKVHERAANPILQLTCVQDLSTAGWLTFKGKKIKVDEQESLCDFEYEVKYKNIKKLNLEDIPSPRVMGFDIEVNSTNPNAMPKANKPGDKVFQISCILGRQGDPEEKYDKYLLSLGEPDHDKVGKDVNLYLYETEADLLVGFTEFMKEMNPQVIVGYNILGFDIPYMIDRARFLFVINSFDQMGYMIGKHSQEKTIKWSSSAYKNQNFQFLDAEGRLFVDLLPLVRRDYRLDNYKLKTVSTHFIGETKDPLTAKGIFKCYRMGMKKTKKGNQAMGVVGKYCVQDSVLVVKLFEVLDTWIGLCEMARVCNVPIFYLYTKGQQIKVYSQVYKKCIKTNHVVEEDGYITKPDEHYHGAIVVDPIPGMHDRVVPFDFASLYPTTIIAYNLDYTTLVVDENIPDKECHVIEWEDHIGCEHDETIRKTKPKAIICSKYRYRFLKEPKGIFPTILENLLITRKNTKKKIKTLKKELETIKDPGEKQKINKFITILDKRQNSYKISANSMYGAMGVKRGYLPFMPGAMCTTAMGRRNIERAAKYIHDKHGGKLVYGDTDSSYAIFPSFESANETWDYCLEVEKDMENLFPSPIKLEFERKIYWRFFILTKKRYMWLECQRDGEVSGKVGKKGVLLARRDNSMFIRELYADIIMRIFNREKKDVILNLISEKFNLLCSGSYDYKNFVVTKSVGEISDYKIRPLPDDPKKREKRFRELKCTTMQEYNIKCLPAQVQLAVKMRKRGQRVDPGTRLEYLITMNGGIKARLFEKIEDPVYQQEHSDIIKIDYLYYLKLCVNPIDQLLTVQYNTDNWMLKQYKLRVIKYKLMRRIEKLVSPHLVFTD